jgi:hypothetical protein
MQLKVLPNALTAILIVVFRVPLTEAHPLTPDNAFPCRCGALSRCWSGNTRERWQC